MYNVVNTLAPSFSIESSLFLQVTRTTIESGLSSKISLIRLCTAELAALERLKKIPIDLQWKKCCEHSSAFFFNLIVFVLASNKNNHESFNEFEFRPDPTTN